MARFHFTTRWLVDATVQEAYAILKDSSSLSTWWPSVYLDVQTMDEGSTGGLGKKVNLWTKGFLPYTLKWNFEVIAIKPQEHIVLEAHGDLNGIGSWTFKSLGDQCEILFDWDIQFDKPYLSAWSFILRPIFGLNHRWAMNQGLKSLQLEILRRRGLKNVEAPPLATFPHRSRWRNQQALVHSAY